MFLALKKAAFSSLSECRFLFGLVISRPELIVPRVGGIGDVVCSLHKSDETKPKTKSQSQISTCFMNKCKYYPTVAVAVEAAVAVAVEAVVATAVVLVDAVLLAPDGDARVTMLAPDGDARVTTIDA